MSMTHGSPNLLDISRDPETGEVRWSIMQEDPGEAKRYVLWTPDWSMTFDENGIVREED